MPKYLFHKLIFRTSTTSVNFDIDDDFEIIEVEYIDEELKGQNFSYRSFLGVPCQPQSFEFTTLFPKYPKSHEKGYATIIELDEGIFKKK